MQDNILNQTELFELSVNQRNILGVSNNNLSIFYNQLVLDFDTQIDSKELQLAISAVINKHKTLSFKMSNDAQLLAPKQYQDDQSKLDFHSVTQNDFSSIELLADSILGYDYNMTANEPIRFCYLNSSNEHKLIVRLFSLWADTYSSVFFCNELAKAITDIDGYKNQLIEEVIEYQNFSAWQNELFYEPEQDGIEFWKNYNYQLGNSTLPFKTNLDKPFQPKRIEIATIYGGEYQIIKKEALRNETTEEFFLFSQFINYLSSFNNEDLTVGYVGQKRLYEELQNTFGIVNKALPISVEKRTMEHECTIGKEIQANLQQIEGWADYFYIDREKSENPQLEFFNYVFQYVDLSNKEDQKAPFEIENLYAVCDTFDVKVCCINYGDYLSVEVYFDENKFSVAAAQVLTSQLKTCYNFLDEDSTSTITVFERAIINSANRTNTRFESFNSVINLFENSVRDTPEAIAVITDDVQLSYKEIDEQSNRLAHYLVNQKGIVKGDAICILLERSPWFIISMLAAIKTGAYYVPVDTAYPSERINFILEDCEASILLSSRELQEQNNLDAAMVIVPEETSLYSNESATSLHTHIENKDIVYAIYTSGSTGNPKGCLITHSNLLNYVQWANQHYFQTEDSGNWGLFTSLSFDLTVTALYTSLTRGKKIWMPGSDKDIMELLQESFTHPEIDTLKLTPTHLSILKDLDISETSIRTIICGGEQLKKQQVDYVKTLNENIRVFNEYGPTETTVGCVVKEIMSEDEKVLIGTPIANTKIHIVNEKEQDCSIGKIGEIYISGLGVSNGFLNRPEMTEEKFTTDYKFSVHSTYKTGDLGRWNPDGNIEYIGRRDDQVKIRGYRIELNEIERTIALEAEATDVVVLAVESEKGDTDLVAFISASDELSSTELTERLSNVLPSYMVPANFFYISEIPLTVNGKVDKKALLKLKSEEIYSDFEYIAPRNEQEETLVHIWEEILERKNIGMKDDFFRLGGHSIKAIQLVNRYHKSFNVKLALKDIFEVTSLEGHSDLIGRLKNDVFETIDKVEEAESYALSRGQHRLWVLSQLENTSVAYNIVSTASLEYDYNLSYFEDAINVVMERHEILRTVFRPDASGEVRQWVKTTDELKFELEHKDFSEVPNNEGLVSEFITEASLQPFDLVNGPLVRAILIKVSPDRYLFCYIMHHIISDGWSMGVLSKEVMAVYESHWSGVPAKLPELTIQYKDYANWQIDQINSSSLSKNKDYWTNALSGNLPRLDLPTTKIRPSVNTHNGRLLRGYLSEEVTAQLKQYGDSNNGSLFISLLTIWNILFQKYTSQEDIIIGSPIAARDHADLVNQIGFYVNTLVLRNKIDHNEDFNTIYTKVKESTLSAFDNQMYPFDALADDLNLDRTPGRNAIFDVLLALQNTGGDENFDHQTVELNEVVDRGIVLSKFDLELSFQENGSIISFDITYNTDVYELGVMTQLIENFKQLTQQLLANPQQNLAEIAFLSELEQQKILMDFNDTSVAYPKEQTLVQLFQEQVEQNPTALAIVHGDKTLTYDALDQLSNQFANFLIEKHGIGKGDFVGIRLERSEMVLVAILGLLKVGAAYVPIDMSYPEDRVNYMMTDANSNLVIDANVIINFEATVQSLSNKRPNVSLEAEDLAYIIYTSGSTGTPKGVMVEQKSIVRLVKEPNYVEIAREDSVLGLSSFSFDGSTFDIYIALLNGAKLVIAPKDVFSDFERLDQLMADQNISLFFLTTVFFNSIAESDLESIHNVKYILFGGEQVSTAHVKMFKEKYPEVNLHHVYGPTENTTFSTYYAIDEVSTTARTIPIGQPISNSTCYVLDANNNIVPIGVTGEICVGGDGLAKGYLNNQELTNDKFVPHPFISGERIYKTGDLGRWLLDGSIEFVGRIDHQVKIRGYRIELGEIEKALVNQADVNQAVVKVKQLDGGQVLAAYISSDEEIDKRELRDSLRNVLPEYMLPSYYKVVDIMPLNSNGKIEKKELPEVTEEDLIKENFIAPETETQISVANIWKEILNVQSVSMLDRFFQLGGDSIKAIKTIAMVNECFDLKLNAVLLLHDVSVLDFSDFIEENLEKKALAKIDDERITVDKVVI